MSGRESEHLGVSMFSSQGKSWVLFVWVKVMRRLAQMVEIPEWIQLLLMIIIMVDVLVYEVLCRLLAAVA